MSEKNYKRLIGLLLLGVFFVMLVLTCLTPMLADDFSYSFSYADRSRRIASLGDIVESMTAHRRTMNGRVFSHSLAQLFLILPKMVFNVCNALNAVFLVALLYMFFRSESRTQNLLLLLCTVFMIWIFVPVFGQVFLWLDGSLNYSWAMTAIFAFLWPFFAVYMNEENRVRGWRLPFFILLAFVAGGYSESASFAALFVAFCFGLLVFFRERRVNKVLLGGFISGCLGFLFMMLAPSEFGGRTSSTDLGTIAHNIQRMFAAPQEVLQELYCLFAALFAVACVLRVEKRKLVAAAVLFLGSMAAIAPYVVAAYFPWRSLCAVTFYLILPCLILLQGLFEKGCQWISPALTAVLAAIFVFSFVLGVGDIGVVYYESRQRETAILTAIETGQDSVEIYQYSGNTKYCASHDLPDAYEDGTLWPNIDIAAYYGIGTVIGKPMLEDYFE